MTEDRKRPPPTLTGEEARQGRIVLNTPARRAIFIGGFVLIGVFGFIALLVSLA